jgi:alkanesulfonate monooxygenase SsuD/methylene tetrahydromethanopterin reductase-like flavin-dependent oxidoreductase (luciferase family)
MRIGMIQRMGWRAELGAISSSAEAFARMCDEAEAAVAGGVDGLFAYDHLEAVPDAREAACFEAWTTLSAVAARVPDVRIGTLVSGVSLRNIGLLAKMAVTVDAVSDGRLVLGLGAGWYRDELHRYGYPVMSYRQRASATAAACRALRALWTGQPASATVGSTTLSEAICTPLPVHGTIPIWIGGASTTMQEIAVTVADGINVGGTPQEVRSHVESIAHQLVTQGRERETFELSTEVQLLWEPAADQLQAVARRSGTTPEDFATWNLVGTDEQIREMVRGYRDAGIDTLIVFAPASPKPNDLVELIRLVKQEA